MKRPNFFIIGAPKCGTTSLANWLGQHPQVFISPHKEPHYFNTDDSFRFIHEEAHYLELFHKASQEHVAIGEASTWYLFSQTAVPQIERFTNQTARYVVCLRNPVEMVQAVHAQNIFSGNETVTDFSEAWALQEARRNGESLPPLSTTGSHLQYRDACALGAQIARLLKTVPRDRVHVVLLDDIKSDPHAVYDSVLDFLGVPQAEIPIFLKARNVAHRPRSLLVARMLSLGGRAKRKIGLRKGLGILNRIRQMNKIEQPRAPLSSGMITTLRKNFEPEIVRLEALLNRDLQHWREP